MRTSLVLVSVVLGAFGLNIAFPVPARAEDGSFASRLKAAKKACVVGDYKAGANTLGDLYVETNDPTLLYNQARCYEQNNQNQQAIDRFREYLRKATNLTPQIKADVEKHIAECKASLREGDPGAVTPPQTAATAEPPPPTIPTAAPPVESSPAPTPVANLTETSDSAATTTSPFYKSWWFWGTVGGAVVAGTVTAVLLASGAKGDCDGEKNVCLGVK